MSKVIVLSFTKMEIVTKLLMQQRCLRSSYNWLCALTSSDIFYRSVYYDLYITSLYVNEWSSVQCSLYYFAAVTSVFYGLEDIKYTATIIISINKSTCAQVLQENTPALRACSVKSTACIKSATSTITKISQLGTIHSYLRQRQLRATEQARR